MARPELDLSLYLVTQSESLAHNHTWESNLREAIEGGVTIIQIRYGLPCLPLSLRP
jgi:thiamine monophosphate synthase